MKTSRESIERALIHHGVWYSPPGPGQSKWRIRTFWGEEQMTNPMAAAYCLGLADRERFEERIRRDGS